MYHIYHNPRCSKSRKALEILKLNTENYKIINYLQSSIDKDAIREVINTRNISMNNLIRKNEAIFKDLNLNLDELFTNQIIDIISENPILLERPLLIKYVDNSFVKSIVGRPPESILTLFD